MYLFNALRKLYKKKRMQIFTERSSTASISPKLEQVYQNLLNNKDIGFVDIPARGYLFEQSEKLVQDLKKNYTHFVVVGIGGSSMGARALVELSGEENVLFLDNVDTVQFKNLWKSLTREPKTLSATAFIVVSKSGSTIEILWNYSLLEKELRSVGINIFERSYFITESNGNPLAQLAKTHQRPVLEVPLDIGGRFSVLTPVGLVIAGLCGFNLNDLQTGAKAALANKTEVLQDCQTFLNSFQRNEVVTQFWFYSSAYGWFGAWLEQLWAESLGKKTTVEGRPAPAFSMPVVAIGARDQHSILQQVAHGTLKNKFVYFYGFQSAENSDLKIDKSAFPGFEFINDRAYGDLIAAQARATEEALRLNSVSTHFIKIDDRNLSFSTGYLFMHFQLVVAVLGLHEQINPFDQPGVTLGKELTLKRLKK